MTCLESRLAKGLLCAAMAAFLSATPLIGLKDLQIELGSLGLRAGEKNASQAISMSVKDMQSTVSNPEEEVRSTTHPIEATTRSEVMGSVQEQTAVCVVGGIRSFIYPKIYKSIKEFTSKLAPATVFVVMQKTTSLGYDTYKQIPFDVDQVSLKAALDVLQPVHVEIHNDSTCRQFETVEPETKCCDDNALVNYLQLGWIWHCLNVVKKYEKDHAMKFDLIARIRPDITYFSLQNLPKRKQLLKNGITLTQKHSPRLPADWLFIFTPPSLNWFLLTMQEVQTHCDVKHSCLKPNSGETRCGSAWAKGRDTSWSGPEYSGWFRQDQRGRFMRSNHTWAFAAVNLGPVIVRSKNKADCFRSLDTGIISKCNEYSKKGWDMRRLERVSEKISRRSWLSPMRSLRKDICRGCHRGEPQLPWLLLPGRSGVPVARRFNLRLGHGDAQLLPHELLHGGGLLPAYCHIGLYLTWQQMAPFKTIHF